jgi:IclR family transcriptional regulator, acetate operon repressor
MTELTAMTDKTITDPETLQAALKVIRNEQVGTDDQEFIDKMVAVSVPIPSPKGPPIAAISIHAPVFRRSLEDLRGFIPDLRESADELAKLIYE